MRMLSRIRMSDVAKDQDARRMWDVGLIRMRHPRLRVKLRMSDNLACLSLMIDHIRRHMLCGGRRCTSCF